MVKAVEFHNGLVVNVDNISYYKYRLIEKEVSDEYGLAVHFGGMVLNTTLTYEDMLKLEHAMGVDE